MLLSKSLLSQPIAAIITFLLKSDFRDYNCLQKNNNFTYSDAH